MLSVPEVVQESTGFSPNDLVFGHTVRGPLAVIKDGLVDSGPPKNLNGYVNGFCPRLYTAVEKTREHLKCAHTLTIFLRKGEHFHVTCSSSNVNLDSSFKWNFHPTVHRRESRTSHILPVSQSKMKRYYNIKAEWEVSLSLVQEIWFWLKGVILWSTCLFNRTIVTFIFVHAGENEISHVLWLILMSLSWLWRLVMDNLCPLVWVTGATFSKASLSTTHKRSLTAVTYE